MNPNEGKNSYDQLAHYSCRSVESVDDDYIWFKGRLNGKASVMMPKAVR